MIRFLRFALVLAAVAALVAAIVFVLREVRPTRLDSPAAGDASDIEDQLIGQPAIAVPPARPVLHLLFRYPEDPGGWGELTLGLDQDGTLPRRGAVEATATVLATPGRYLSVRDENGTFVYALFLGERFLLHAEYAEGGEPNAEFGGSIGSDGRHWAGGVVSARVPFQADGIVQVFEVRGGEVDRVLLQLPLAGSPPPARGRSFLVPFS